jgi:hypothetical protein
MMGASLVKCWFLFCKHYFICCLQIKCCNTFMNVAATFLHSIVPVFWSNTCNKFSNFTKDVLDFLIFLRIWKGLLREVSSEEIHVMTLPLSRNINAHVLIETVCSLLPFQLIGMKEWEMCYIWSSTRFAPSSYLLRQMYHRIGKEMTNVTKKKHSLFI